MVLVIGYAGVWSFVTVIRIKAGENVAENMDQLNGAGGVQHGRTSQNLTFVCDKDIEPEKTCDLIGNKKSSRTAKVCCQKQIRYATWKNQSPDRHRCLL